MGEIKIEPGKMWGYFMDRLTHGPLWVDCFEGHFAQAVNKGHKVWENDIVLLDSKNSEKMMWPYCIQLIRGLHKFSQQHLHHHPEGALNQP